MKNAGLGDTRNKLDDNSHLKQRRNNSKKTFKSLKDELSDNKPSVTKSKKLTKGQIFKQTHGFSKSVYKAMKKNLVGIITGDSLKVYRQLRNERKKAARIEAAKKRSDSVAIRKYGKDTTKKSNKKKG